MSAAEQVIRERLARGEPVNISDLLDSEAGTRLDAIGEAVRAEQSAAVSEAERAAAVAETIAEFRTKLDQRTDDICAAHSDVWEHVHEMAALLADARSIVSEYVGR